MKIIIKTILMVLLCIGQLAVIATMIGKVYVIKKASTKILLECETYDPYDALRGRYLQVQLKSRIVNDNLYKEFPSLKNMSEDKLQALAGKEVYCVYGPGYNGYEYRLVDIKTRRPGKGFVFLKAKLEYAGDRKLILGLPVFKYYIQEDLALKADKILGRVFESILEDGMYIELEVDHEGNYIINSLYIGEQPIAEYLKTH